MTAGIGLDLSRRFFEGVVAPLVETHFPSLKFAAARIGRGSEVLGFDTEMSADHDYGPNVQLFLTEEDFPEVAPDLLGQFDAMLPERFEDWPVRYACSNRPPAPVRTGSKLMLGSDHGVEIYTVSAWCERFIQRTFPLSLTLEEWLFYPEQLFLIATAGAVFRDDVGEISDLRATLHYLPDDVWLYKLSAQWHLIAEERVYVGRSGDAGDELGSRIIGARMVENLMRLAMLIERRYSPYPKWFGTSFAKLVCASRLSPILESALATNQWQERERYLAKACGLLAELQIEKEIPGAIAPMTTSIHERPFQFVDSLAIGDAIQSAIEDVFLRQLPNFGAADQILKSNAILSVPKLARATVEGAFATKLWWQNR